MRGNLTLGQFVHFPCCRLPVSKTKVLLKRVTKCYRCKEKPFSRQNSIQRFGQSKLKHQLALLAQHFQNASLLPKTSLWAPVCKRFIPPEFHFECQVQAEPQRNSKQNPLWTLWVSPGFYLKELPSVPLKLDPSLHAIQLKSNSALLKGLQTSIKWAVNLKYDLGVSKEVYQSFQQT